MGTTNRVSGQERVRALEALRGCCRAFGRGVSGPEFEEYCAARGLGRPWRRHHLTTRGGVHHAKPWNDVVRSVGFEAPPNRRRRAPAEPPPGARRCQNAPECRRSPARPEDKFCKVCQATWAHTAPDSGVASFVRTTR